jgi:hypothetical protein
MLLLMLQTASTIYRPAGAGMAEFTNTEVGIRLVIPDFWQSRVNIAASKVEFRCSQTEFGCSLTVASEVAPKNLTSITDVQRKDWTFQFTNKDQVSARDFSLGSRSAFESKGVGPEGREIRYIHVLARDFGRIYVFSFMAGGNQREEFARAFEQVLQSFSPVQTSGFAGRDEEPLRFLKEEQTAYQAMFGLYLSSMICGAESSKLCSVEELVRTSSPVLDPKGIQSLTNNPDYSFRISGTLEKTEIVATPKRPGVGGFLEDGEGLHYNPQGPASKSDPLVRADDLPYLKPR